MEVPRSFEEEANKRSSSSSLHKIDHSLTKENLTPCVPGSRIRHPLRPNSILENLPESTPPKSLFDSCAPFESQEPPRDLDAEIEAIENEISRLSSRLDLLRLERAKQIHLHVKSAAEKRGRFVPVKFMDPPPIIINPRKIEESASCRKINPRSRGLSMVPSEVARGMNLAAAAAAATPVGRRGISLGPAEIYSASRTRQVTPVYQSQSRRKSCFWKLQEVDELKVIKERGKSMSMSPKSRKLMATTNSKMAVTSLGNGKNKSLKKEEGIIASIQPKKLFKDGDKSVVAKKPGRMVASRYSNINKSSNGVRKRSLPEENDKEIKICDKKRISLSDKSEAVSEISLKQSGDDPLSVVQELEMLPKIRTLQCLNESPRDSGAAKRVIELVNRKSHFSLEEHDDDIQSQPMSACKALSFEDVEEEEEEEEKTMPAKEYLNVKTFPRINGNSPRDSGAAKRVSELIGRKSYFSSEDGVEEEIYGCRELSFEEED